MRIYKYCMRFRIPAFDQSDCSICYNYDLNVSRTMHSIPMKVSLFLKCPYNYAGVSEAYKILIVAIS